MVIGMKVFEELASAPDGEHWKRSITFYVYRDSYFAYLNRRPERRYLKRKIIIVRRGVPSPTNEG